MTNALIVTTTKTEKLAVIAAFNGTDGHDPNPKPIHEKMYYFLGKTNDVNVYLVETDMGSAGLGASKETVEMGIEALQPVGVILCGIAFGINEKKQKIGDILISTQLMLYDLQRVGRNEAGELTIKLRGEKPHASKWLINRFRALDNCIDKESPELNFGLILTGEKLVDETDFRNQLLEFESEAIGGDMEGGGLYEACQNKHTDWIIVKAICDWADGNKKRNKKKRQKIAAENAANLVFQMFSQAPLIKGYDYRKENSANNETVKTHYANNLYGRDLLLDECIESINEGNHLILFHGLPGIGKTVLAETIANNFAENFSKLGIIKIDLLGTKKQPLPEEEVIKDLIKNIAPETEIPESLENLLKKLNYLVSDKTGIFILDNTRDNLQIQSLLKLIQQKSILLIITSRWQFSPLGIPSFKYLSKNIEPLDKNGAGKQMMIDLAPRLNDSEAEEIVELCSGIPKALEIVAASIQTFKEKPVKRFIQQMVDKTSRLKMTGMDAAFQTSYELLGIEHKNALQQLGIFEGEFDIPAAAAILNNSNSEMETCIESLYLGYWIQLEKGSDSYKLHDMVRDFVQQQSNTTLINSGKICHSKYFLSIINSASDLFKQGSKYIEALAILDKHWGNILAGQRYAAEATNSDNEAARLCKDYPNAGYDVMKYRLPAKLLIQWCLDALDTINHGYGDDEESANIKNTLGIAYRNLPTGDRTANLHQAIEYYSAALYFWTPETAPLDYAMTQNNLGIAYQNLPLGDRAANLRKSIECYSEALRFLTPETAPLNYAGSQNNLGTAYSDLPTGDRAANLRKSIECYSEALRFRTPEATPLDYAMTQNNLGTAYADLPTGDRAANLQQAIECFSAALRIYTPQTTPLNYAGSQNNLGIAYRNLPTGDLSTNYQKAIECYSEALRFYTPEATPFDHSNIQNNLGILYSLLNREEDAQKAWEEAIKSNPNNAGFHASLSRVYRNLAMREKAEQEITFAKDLSSNESLYDQACIAAIGRLWDEAFQLLEICLKKNEITVDWVNEDPDWEEARQDKELNNRLQNILDKV